MLKMIARLEHKIGERVFHLHCDPDSPLHELKDALSHLMAHVVNVEKQAQLELDKKKEEEKVEVLDG